MKKITIIAASLLLFLCAAMLLGCTPEKAPAEPVLYWNADRGTERTPDTDGSYQVRFILNGEMVTLRVPNEQIMKRIDIEYALGLTVDKKGTVTDVASIIDMPEYYPALNYSILSFGGKTVKLGSSYGQTVVIKYDENTRILDVSDFATTKGEPTNLQKGDGATAVANEDGSIAYIMVVRRQGILTAEKRYCPVCEADVDFYNWYSDFSMPSTAGHYYLEKDIELTGTAYMSSCDVTLDLNGKTVTMVKEGQRFYSLGEGATLNVIDTVGNGRAVVISSGKGAHDSGMFAYMIGSDSVFNMYSGTLDATDCIASYGCIVNNNAGVFNMYGGTLLGGTTTGVGGGAVIVQSAVNIYGGEIIGGYCSNMSGNKNNPPGGGCIRHNGASNVLNIYGGVIKDGKSDYKGGCIYINGPTNIYGGTITGGSAEGMGGGIYANASAVITISGDVTVADNSDGDIYMSIDNMIKIGESGLGDANVGIDMATPGTFVTSAVPEDKVNCFFSNSGTIVRNGDGTLSLK